MTDSGWLHLSLLGAKLWNDVNQHGDDRQLEFGEFSEVPTGGMQMLSDNFTKALTVCEEVLKCDTCPDLNSMKDILDKWTDLVLETDGACYDNPETMLEIDTYKSGITDMLLPAHTALNTSIGDRKANFVAITTVFPLFIAQDGFTSTHQRLKGRKES